MEFADGEEACVWISDFWTWHGYCIHGLTEAVSTCISPIQNQGCQNFRLDEVALFVG